MVKPNPIPHLDLEMPVMNGVQFRIEQSREPRLRQIPVIVMSASKTKYIRKLRPNGILIKPLRMNSIAERVTEFLG